MEVGKQGLNSNIAHSWYPVTDKKVYRLPQDALQPDKLFPGAQVNKALGNKKSLRAKRAQGLLKPIKSVNLQVLSQSLSSAKIAQLGDGARALIQPDACSQSSESLLLRRTSDSSSFLDDVSSTQDLVNSDYFQSLLTHQDPRSKHKNKKKVPRALPKLQRQHAPDSEFISEPLVGGQFLDEFPSPGETNRQSYSPAAANQLSAVCEGSNELLASDMQQPSVTSYTTPMMDELKESIHHMLLTQATPMEGSVYDESEPVPQIPTAPLTPGKRFAGRMNDDMSPYNTPMASRSGRFRATSADADDLSSMLSVNSGLSNPSQRRSGGKDIIKEYNERITNK